MDRRRFVLGSGFSLAVLRSGAAWPADEGIGGSSLRQDLVRIEQASKGRLGVSVLDTTNNQTAGHRQNERFPMCSTFKILAAAAILSRIDTGRDTLARRIRFQAEDVVVNSPITKNRVGGDGMSLDELCAAAMTYSDNTAGNLLLSTLEGPEGLTHYMRSIGDNVSRLDRWEPDLNESVPGDPRDTTTPDAMLQNLRTLLNGTLLSQAAKEKLTEWLVGNKTGATRLRAGTPKDWPVGDKTGAGERGSTNDVAVIWPPGRKQLFISIFLTETDAPPNERNAVLASVAQAVSQALLRIEPR